MIAYGTVGVILALYLNAVGLSNDQLGLLLTLTLLGDSVISLGVTRWADRVGRRVMLTSSCLLMVFAGVVYGEVLRPSFGILLAAATVGVLSPSGNEVRQSGRGPEPWCARSDGRLENS
jgi:MFS family permease